MTLSNLIEGRERYVPYELGPGRVDAIWTRLRATELGERRICKAPTPGQWSMVGGAALAVTAGVLLWMSKTRTETSPWSGTRLHAGNESIRVSLQDGSAIEALPHASVELLSGTEQEVRLALRQGTGRFSVTKNPQRRFVVETGPVQVRVVGTRFEVERDNADRWVNVRVQEGIVAVDANSETRRVRAGEALRVALRPSPMAAAPHGASPHGKAENAAKLHDIETAAIHDESILVFTAEELGLYDDPPQASQRPRGPRPSAAARRQHLNPKDRTAATVGARVLLENAQQAQAAGRRRKAAALYRRIMRDHPEDARAPLAAFELGRLRMDFLSDPAGAARALQWSLRHDARSVFREDALARLVRSAEQVDPAACSLRKRAYLLEYPEGRYVQDVSRRCRLEQPQEVPE